MTDQPAEEVHERFDTDGQPKDQLPTPEERLADGAQRINNGAEPCSQSCECHTGGQLVCGLATHNNDVLHVAMAPKGFGGFDENHKDEPADFTFPVEWQCDQP